MTQNGYKGTELLDLWSVRGRKETMILFLGSLSVVLFIFFMGYYAGGKDKEGKYDVVNYSRG